MRSEGAVHNRHEKPPVGDGPSPAAVALGADLPGWGCNVLVLVGILVDLIGQVVDYAGAKLAPSRRGWVVPEVVPVSLHTDMGTIAALGQPRILSIFRLDERKRRGCVRTLDRCLQVPPDPIHFKKFPFFYCLLGRLPSFLRRSRGSRDKLREGRRRTPSPCWMDSCSEVSNPQGEE